MTNKTRVRFAPSPTGHLHIGGARSALFNYLFARSQGGQFILRIEDTDQERNVSEAMEKLHNSLKWLGLSWDEGMDHGGEYGPYRSMERLDIYQQYVDQLLEEGKAYYCYMTSEELEQEREQQIARGETPKYSGAHRHLTAEQRAAYEAEGRQPVVRFRVPEGQNIVFQDAVRGEVTFESDGIGDFVIMRASGIPTYNFAVTIDDYLMEISHVIRGEEHLSNTPRQILVYEAFGWSLPQFAHVALILNEDRQKMSKRDETIIQFIEQYQERGYLPEAIVNFLALLGWSPEGEEEFFTLEELSDQFSLDRVSKAPAVFDTHKLQWMNNQYITKAELSRVIDLALPHLVKAGRLPEDMTDEQRQWAERLIALYQEQLAYGAQIVELTDMFFQTELSYDDDAMAVLKEEQVPEVLEGFIGQMEALEAFEPAEIKKGIKAVQKETGHKGKKLFMPVRVATTGQTHGPELQEAIALLGKERIIARVKNVLDLIK